MNWMNYNNNWINELIMLSKSPKILSIYQAVIELLDEGTDISSLKVSDITNRAGIGKGTAYDYFHSKEEIIVKAMIYDISQGLFEMRELICKQKNFHAKFLCFLNPGNTEHMHQHHNRMKRYLHYFYQTQEQHLSSQLKRTLAEVQRQAKAPDFFELFTDLYQSAVSENLVRPGLDIYYIRIGLLTQLLSFIHYQRYSEKNCSITKDSEEQIINYLYENLLYMWR